MFPRLLIFLLAISFISCEEETRNEPPENLIAEDLYMDVLLEMKLFDAMLQSVDSLAQTDSLKSELFKNYSVSEEVFLSSHEFYQSDPLKHKERLDSLAARITKTLEEINETSGFQIMRTN